jgi:hypothetical protein
LKEYISGNVEVLLRRIGILGGDACCDGVGFVTAAVSVLAMVFIFGEVVICSVCMSI